MWLTARQNWLWDERPGGFYKNERGNSASGHRSTDLMENKKKKGERDWEREFYSAEVAESRTGLSLFNDGAGGLGMGIWGYDRRYLWIVFKWWGRWGGDAAVLHCAGWERGSPMLSHFLPSVGLIHCVYPPTLWQWKKAGRALALLVNEALTSLAHTHTHKL